MPEGLVHVSLAIRILKLFARLPLGLSQGTGLDHTYHPQGSPNHVNPILLSGCLEDAKRLILSVYDAHWQAWIKVNPCTCLGWCATCCAVACEVHSWRVAGQHQSIMSCSVKVITLLHLQDCVTMQRDADAVDADKQLCGCLRSLCMDTGCVVQTLVLLHQSQ